MIYELFAQTFNMGLGAAVIGMITLLFRYGVKCIFKMPAPLFLWAPFLIHLICPIAVAAPISLIGWSPYATQDYYKVPIGPKAVTFSELRFICTDAMREGTVAQLFSVIWIVVLAAVIVIYMIRHFVTRPELKSEVWRVRTILLAVIVLYWYNPIVCACYHCMKERPSGMARARSCCGCG